MQMKPTQPHDALCMTYLGSSCGKSCCWPGLAVSTQETGSPAWEVLGFPTRRHPGGYLWTRPAKPDVWTSIVFDVKFSADPRVGYMRVKIGRVWSPVMRGQTLLTSRRATSLYRAGEAIPAHLRMGLYHDAAYRCPRPVGCSSEFARVAVYRR